MRILHIVDIVELLVIITGKVIYKQSLLTNLSVNTKKRFCGTESSWKLGAATQQPKHRVEKGMLIERYCCEKNKIKLNKPDRKVLE